jgi:hypothetical protein
MNAPLLSSIAVGVLGRDISNIRREILYFVATRQYGARWPVGVCDLEIMGDAGSALLLRTGSAAWPDCVKPRR